MTRRVLLALGSNLGDRRRFLRDAIEGTPDVVAQSRVYETEPVGGPENQGPFLNMVIELQTDLTAKEILEQAKKLERHAERVRTVRNGPRTLDVDLLWIDGETVNLPELTVPHPRMWTRRFVLAPLSELAPDLLHEDWEAAAEGDVHPIGML